jgi:hypothetical protein
MMKYFSRKIGLLIGLSLILSYAAHAWSDHPILSKAALQDMPQWQSIDSVTAKSLQTFLMETEDELSLFLEWHEQWARTNLPNYLPRPDALAFYAGFGDISLVERFLQAIRLNPNSRIPIYLYLMPDEQPEGRPVADWEQITTLPRLKGDYAPTYVLLQEGEKVHPLSVLASASNEPDYGFDLGLFEDNQTAYGKVYGFGKQPFGNPNLPYSSQAPFHMSFFHESWIVYALAPFMNNTFLDYRVSLFRELSVFAFDNGQPYWGWRFLGWSMHYASDATMPYHSKPLPGYSTLRMLWINFKSMIGYPKSQKNAVQLVSNKHTIIEDYQSLEMRAAYLDGNREHPFFKALANPQPHIPYSIEFLENTASKGAADDAKLFDKTILRHMPQHMVADPAVEVVNLAERHRIHSLVREEIGLQAADALNDIIAKRLRAFSMTIRSLMISVLDETSHNKANEPLAKKD